MRGLVLIGLALGAAAFSRMAEEQSEVMVSLVGVQSAVEPTTLAPGTKSAAAVSLGGSAMAAGFEACQYSRWSFYCAVGCAALGSVELIAQLRRGRASAK